MSFCSKCGHQLAKQDRFCVGCGAPVDIAVEKEASPAGSRTGTTSPQQNPPKRSGLKAIIGILLALALAAGGWWGWVSYASPEVRATKQLELAVKYVSENNYKQAVLAFNEAIKINPKEVKAYQGLAKVYTLQNKYDEAQATYEKGLKEVAANEKVSLNLSLAGMYIDRNDLVTAEKIYQELISQDKSLIDAYHGLAIVYQQKGDNAAAENILRQMVANNPDRYRAYNVLALFLSQNNKAEDAFKCLVKSLELEINQQEAYVVLRDMYQGNKISSLTTQPVADMLKFYSYYISQDYPQAIGIYQSKLADQKNNQKAIILAATAMFKTGDQAGAGNLVKQVLNNRLNPLLLGDLARYYQLAGDNAKAREYAIKALQADGTNLEAIALLQTLNSEDSTTKLYTAEALLYNWKPVEMVQQELLFGEPVSQPNQVAQNTGSEEKPAEKPAEPKQENTVSTPQPLLYGNSYEYAVAGIKPGDSDASVIQKLGTPLRTEPGRGDIAETNLIYPGIEICVKDSDHKVYIIYITNSQYATARGIRVGDPQTKVLQAYGSDDNNDNAYRVNGRDGDYREIEFILSNGTVEGILINMPMIRMVLYDNM